MMNKENGTNVPTGRDNTYDKTEVHRKSVEDLFESAFNLNQQKVLNEMFSGGGHVDIEVDPTLTQEGMAADAKAVGDAIAAIEGGGEVVRGPKLDFVYYGMDAISPISVSIREGKELKADAAQIGKTVDQVPTYSGSGYRNYKMPIPEGAKHVEFFTYRSGSGYGSLFLDSDGIIVGGRVAVTGTPFQVRAKIPEGAAYFVYAYSTSLSAAYVHFTSDKPMYGITELGLHVTPICQGVINGIKNAREITDMAWSAVMQLPRTSILAGGASESSNNNIHDYFTANKTYIGAPYTDPTTDYKRRLLFTSTPLEAFYTANLASASVQGQESIYTARAASYYGTCCTGLTTYAMNLPYMYSGNHLNNDLYFAAFPIKDSNDNYTDFDELMLLDVLQVNGHCLVVTDIYRDEDGKVALIEMSEQTRAGLGNASIHGGPYGGIARRYTGTPEEICSSYSSYKILRYRYLDRIRYTPQAQSPVTDGNRLVIPQFPILPYYGNNCRLNSGVTCKLLILQSGYSRVVVKKDGEEFATYDITSSDTYVNVPCDTDSAVYTAALFLYDGDTYVKRTKYCSWYVTEVPVVTTNRVSASEIAFTVKLKTSLFRPWFGTVDGQTTTSGKFRMIYSNYTQTYEEETGYNVYTFNITRAGTSTITDYQLGFWSDKYGALYIDGTVSS